MCSRIEINKYVFTHHPSIINESQINIHGHLHQRKLPHPYYNVCVECTDYKPVDIDSFIR